MTDNLRKSGIDIVGDIPWGTHLCQFYKTKEDLLDLLVPFMKAGLENNEFCMWVTSDPLPVEEVEKTLEEALPGYRRFKARGQMEVVPHTDWYLKDGYFDMRRVLGGWFEKLDAALEKGFDGIRVTGNTAWLEESNWDSFTAYEEELNKIIGDYSLIAICTYSLDKCGASEVIDVVKNHQYALIEREGEWEMIESSERRKAREALREEIAEKLLRANKELDGYARAVSHDLRGPLSAAALANEVLKDSLSDPDPESLRAEAEESTAVIERNLGKCYDLIDDLLALAEAGQQPVRVSDIDVTSVVKEILREQEKIIREKSFEARMDENLGNIRANETQVYQLFSNLLVNAIRHNDSERPIVEIRYLGKDEKGGHRYRVRDNGSGIPPEHAEDIFRPFFKSGKGSDTGVGLSIVKRVVETYSGEIKAYNDGGAVFEFSLSPAPISRRSGKP
jgi:signal transduction histidine kinase